MNAKRLMIALLAALLISGLSTFWLSRRLAKAAHVEPAKKQLMVAANQTLEAGQLLKPESLRLVETPIALTGGFSKIEDVAGRVVLFPLAKDQPILNSYLAPVGVGVGLTAKIPSGMRAISVRSDEVVGVDGFLLPGTHVDVLLTYHSDKSPDPADSDGAAGCNRSGRGAADSPRPGRQAGQRQHRSHAAVEARGLGEAGVGDQPGCDSFRVEKRGR